VPWISRSLEEIVARRPPQNGFFAERAFAKISPSRQIAVKPNASRFPAPLTSFPSLEFVPFHTPEAGAHTERFTIRHSGDVSGHG
jgi:hypothetical protein